MKTRFKLIAGRYFLLLAAFTLLLVSCTDEETDLRDKITGQYAYTVKIYKSEGSALVYLGDVGDNYDITGTMRVIKSSTLPGGLDFYDGNDLMFQGTDVQDAENAIVFDIPSQEAWIGPGNVQISGFAYWEIGRENYHGAFLYDDGSIEIAFSASIMDVDTGLVMILIATPD